MSRTFISCLILSIVFLGAGCALESEHVSQPQFEAVTDSTVETSPSNYAMSSGVVMLTAPIGWSVRQLDAGGASVVEVYGEDPVSQWAYIIVSSPADLDSGEQVSYEAWLEQNGLSSLVGTQQIGGVTMDKFELLSQNNESELNFTAALDPSRPLYARVRVPASNAQAEQILSSLVFFPTDEQQSSAQTIR